MLNANNYRLSGIAVAIALSVTACGGSKNVAPEAFDVSIAAGKSWVPHQGSFTVSDANIKDTLRISAISENGASVTGTQGVYSLTNGLLTVNGTNFSYLPLNDSATSLRYTVSDGQQTASAMLNIAAPVSDPLAYQQWHLRNTGQKAYAMNAEAIAAFLQAELRWSDEAISAWLASRLDDGILVAGEDMNVVSAYQQGATGAGSIAVVVDSGLEINHEDLQANVLPNRSLNMAEGALNVTDPTSVSLTGDHGTSVGGLIAAVGWNGLGGRGVAPDAKLIGMNYLSAQSDLNNALSHGIPGSGITEAEPLVVFNRSYGISYPAVISYDPFDEAVQAYSALTLRQGKGAVNIKSSGNAFRRPGNIAWAGAVCGGANALGLTCLNGNFEPSQNTPYYLSVAAVNSDGKHTSYSTAGANVLVSAPAGEYGELAPAMVTTDQMTCLRGYSSFPSVEADDWPEYTAAFTPFNYPGHPENPSCNYTSTFNGTSSAAPNAAGVVSLIHSANPNLTYREIKDILVKTSTKVDPDNAQVVLPVGDSSFIAHPGWVENSAGYAHNNLYGFGRVNAGAAVALAKSYGAALAEQVTTDWVALGTQAGDAALVLPIADNDANGAVQTIEVTDDVVVEGVQFAFDVANAELTTAEADSQTTAGIDLAIEVTSPAGTKSVLLSSKQAIVEPAFDFSAGYSQGYILKNSVFLSNAFYGESAKGSWTIRLVDTNGADLPVDSPRWPAGYINNQQPSVLEGVAIRVFGH
ncbi:S8 family serine peptidase [Rheinheimera muenzenbergensis]|uniref:S8 family serine peptidase n=1 Tax=Rheinheimera muenzenbergensis TaxID=1193628 RepID=A0ABU8C617_9GAMM